MIPFTSRAVVTMVALAVPLAAGCAPAGSATADAQARAEPGTRVSTPGPSPSTASSRHKPRIPPGVTAGYLLVESRTGKPIAQYHVHRGFRSASVVKILIALDYLESRSPGTAVPPGDLALLRPMLRSSDDDAASALWKRGGQGEIIHRMVREIGLTDTGPPPASRPGFWGYTAISAADVVKIYRYLLKRADPKIRDFILGHLRNATQCASDGFDQYFGIPRAVPRPWAIKQGWSGYGSVPPQKCVKVRANSVAPVSDTRAGPGVDLVRPVLHTTGLVGRGDRLIMVVLTLQPPGATWRNSVARVTALARDVYRGGVR